MVPDLAPRRMARHLANVEVARAGGGELLLIGDSITDFWRNADGAHAGGPVLQKYFGRWSIANFGISGDTTQGVLYRLRNGEGEGFSPRAIMLLIGTNNLGGNSPAEIADGIGAVVLELLHRFPKSRILLLGLFPRGPADDPMRGEIAEINRRIERFGDGRSVHYLDIGGRFLDAQGNIPPEVMSDALHPAPRGYEIWARAVQGLLTTLMTGD